MTINADGNWHATDRDLGRELYIDGDLYAVAAVTSFQQGTLQQITLDETFKGTTNPTANYATGSVPYGPLWVERIPTSLVILAGSRPALAALGTKVPTARHAGIGRDRFGGRAWPARERITMTDRVDRTRCRLEGERASLLGALRRRTWAERRREAVEAQ